MSYKTGRGNVAKKSQRFHAPIKMLFDYQSVAKTPWPRPDMNDVNPDGDGG